MWVEYVCVCVCVYAFFLIFSSIVCFFSLIGIMFAKLANQANVSKKCKDLLDQLRTVGRAMRTLCIHGIETERLKLCPLSKRSSISFKYFRSSTRMMRWMQHIERTEWPSEEDSMVELFWNKTKTWPKKWIGISGNIILLCVCVQRSPFSVHALHKMR